MGVWSRGGWREDGSVEQRGLEREWECGDRGGVGVWRENGRVETEGGGERMGVWSREGWRENGSVETEGGGERDSWFEVIFTVAYF